MRNIMQAVLTCSIATPGMMVQVENPIAYEPSRAVRILSIGHLHARYAALLLAPWQLSADYSFDCIPLVRTVADPRNALTMVLYGALAALIVRGSPPAARAVTAALGPTNTGRLSDRPRRDGQGSSSGVAPGHNATAAKALTPVKDVSSPADTNATSLSADSALSDHPGRTSGVDEHAVVVHRSTTESGAAPGKGNEAVAAARREAEKQALARWRLFVAGGLLVAPFVPASNVVLWVGTALGERLLYLPSMGFCLLAAQLSCSLLQGRCSKGPKLLVHDKAWHLNQNTQLCIRISENLYVVKHFVTISEINISSHLYGKSAKRSCH